MLSDILKQNTLANHQLLESKLIGQMRSIRNEQDYGKLLSVFYSFFGGLELTIAKHSINLYLPDYLTRRKTAALANDLQFINAELPTLAEGNDVPQILDIYQAFGALYVIEGSTLGGKVISKMLGKQLDLDSENLSFFNAYGEQTTSMWLTFKLLINQPMYALKEDVIVATANDTFLKFSNWFDHQNQGKP